MPPRTRARSSSPRRSARRRVQDVPFSINAQTQADIQRANAQTIEDISRNVAGLTVQNLGPGQSQVSVRGVSAGQIARDQPGVKEQVGIYLDETVTSLSLFTPDFDLFDLNRVETLRGPQGTLFGVRQRRRHDPLHHQPAADVDRVEGTVEGDVKVLKGGDIGYSLKGAVNMPLGPTAALRVVGYGTHFGGFIDSRRAVPRRTSTTAAGSAGAFRCCSSRRPSSRSRRASSIRKSKAAASTAKSIYILFDNQFTTGGGTTSANASNI